MGRFLRSKRARALLWYAADGRCEMCGEILPSDWQADHVVPWRITHRTNVHEMAALCPYCNRKKGGSMAAWRDFQVQFADILTTIQASNTLPDALYADIVPGGGKSTIPLLLTRLIPKYADKIIWVTPRITLARQASKSFDSQDLRALFGHKGRCRQSGNEKDPTRGEIAYSTTYQAIEKAPEIHELEFKRSRYILVLDEPHHAWRYGTDLGPYAQALAPLVRRAALRVFMSGTFERWDKKPIAFLPYREVPGTTRLELDFPEEWLVRYRRMDGLQEGTIVPIYFEGKDATGTYVDQYGEEKTFHSFDDEDAEIDNGGMLNVALRTEYAREILRQTTDHWLAHRQHWAPSKMLVVAPFIEVAKQYAQWLFEDRGLHAPIAVTGDKIDTVSIISRFCDDPHAQALVTVGIAYEGLDVPSLTHLACLTLYRSKPWIYQCFGRVWRKVKGKEGGYVFTPDDPLMREVVEEIKREQTMWAEQKRRVEVDGIPGPKKKVAPLEPIVALGSRVISERIYDLEEELTENERTEILGVQTRNPFLKGLSPLQIKRAFVDWSTASLPEDSPELPTMLEKDMPLLSVKEYEIRMRRGIERYVVAVDHAYFESAYGTTSRELIRHFNKKRGAMSSEELRVVWEYLHRRYPLQQSPVEDPIHG